MEPNTDSTLDVWTIDGGEARLFVPEVVHSGDLDDLLAWLELMAEKIKRRVGRPA